MFLFSKLAFELGITDQKKPYKIMKCNYVFSSSYGGEKDFSCNINLLLLPNPFEDKSFIIFCFHLFYIYLELFPQKS